MGHVPLPLPFYAQRYPDGSIRTKWGIGVGELERQMRRRWLPWRRRAAHDAVLELTRRREVELGYIEDVARDYAISAPARVKPLESR